MAYDTHARNAPHNIRQACAVSGQAFASDSGLESRK